MTTKLYVTAKSFCMNCEKFRHIYKNYVKNKSKGDLAYTCTRHAPCTIEKTTTWSKYDDFNLQILPRQQCFSGQPCLYPVCLCLLYLGVFPCRPGISFLRVDVPCSRYSIHHHNNHNMGRSMVDNLQSSTKISSNVVMNNVTDEDEHTFSISAIPICTL